MSKATKLPRPLEKHVQAACKVVLEANGCRVFRRNTGVMPLEHKGKSRVFRAGEKGAADLYGYFPDGRHFECEVKRDGERPRYDQVLFLRECAASGVPAFWVDSADDLARFLSVLIDGGRVVYPSDEWTFREKDKKTGRVVVRKAPGGEFEVWCKGLVERKEGGWGVIGYQVLNTLNRARFQGFGDWRLEGDGVVGGGRDGMSIQLTAKRASDEAEAIVAEEKRQASALARVMPFLRELAEIVEGAKYILDRDLGNHFWYEDCGTKFSDVVDLVVDFDHGAAKRSKP